MAKVLGLTVPDEFARNYNAADINTRIAMLKWIQRPDLVDKAVSAWANETYGYMGGALQNGEIKRLLKQAGTEGWSEARIKTALMNTKYWKSHTAAQRNWDQLSSTDPKTAKQMVADARGNVTALAARLGITISSARLSSLAQKIASEGITDAGQIQRMVAAEAQFTGGNLSPGDISAGVSQIKARASDYGVMMSDQAAFDWAQRLAAGTATQDGVNEFLLEQSKARFASNKMIQDALARGQTVRDALDPQIAQVADLLEIDPDTIRLTDSRWSPILEKTDGPDVRVMTQSEAAQYARSLPEWNKTANAQASAATFAERLAQTFGKVA